MEKGCENHKNTLYSSKGKIVYVVGKPCNIYRLRGNPIVIIRIFPAICKYYMVSPQKYTIFPFKEYRVPLWLLQPFVIDSAGKTYKLPINPCKHLQCKNSQVLSQLDIYDHQLFFSSKVIRYLGVLYVACSLDFKLCSITYVWFLYLTKFLNSKSRL